MARFSASGDEDGRDERRHASKKPRTSTADSGESPFRFPCARRRVPIDLYEESEMESDRLSPVEEPDEDEEGEEEECDYEEDEEEEEEEEVQDQQSRDAPAPVTVTLTDPDVLDCPICFEPLSPPVYQCENGHISCPSCCIKMKNKCGTCSRAIGYCRCRAMEKVLESVKIACKNKQHGCGETINYKNMPKWVVQPRAKKLFLMPKDFIASIRLIKIELMIQSLAK
ncbi:uncharacterized protein [Primulina huaijiensis]|uniref:uncharacterized protein isoform X3 n=1 Tax=Primulina huaijiensis TaxID=1492673 RepID=UPI003CC77337